MQNPIDVYLPCQVFPVLARYGQFEDISTLEFLILRAVQAGEHSIPRLRYIFGVSERMMFEALRGLWSLERLVFDFASNEVHLSQETKELFEQKKLDKLALATAEFEQCELMLDLVCGTVLTVDGDSAPPKSNATIPYVRGTVNLARITNDSVFAALNSGERARSYQARGMKLWEASISFRPDEQMPKIRFKKIKVASRRTPTGLEVIVLDREGLRYNFRRSLSRYLTRIVNEGDDPAFADRLRSKSSTDQEPFPETSNLLDRLLVEVTQASACPADSVPKSHADLRALGRSLEEGVSEEIVGEARIEPVVGAETHEAIITEMLLKAREQVVIACPFLTKEGLFRLRLPLRQALKNRKRVIILWSLGRRSGNPADTLVSTESSAYDALDQGVKNQIAEFSADGRFFFSDKPTRTRANFVVCDNSKVLLTSLNVFGAGKDSATDVGVLVQQKNVTEEGREKKREEETTPLALAIDVLTWAREVVPDQSIKEAIKLWPKDYSVMIPVRFPNMPAAPPQFEPREEAEITKAKIDVWSREWQEYAHKIEQLCRRIPSARLVRDGEHRQLLDKALKSANRRLVIASDYLGENVINASMRELLRDRIASLIPVRLIYREAPAQSSNGSLAEQALQSLASDATVPADNAQFLRAPNNARILIDDDIAVISSYSFLSHAGNYARDRGARNNDLGILLSGPGISDAFANTLARAYPTIREIPSTEQLPTTPVAVGPELPLVIRCLSEREGDEGLINIFAKTYQAWELLDQVASLRFGTAKLRRAAAACLATNARETDAAGYDKWLAFLVREALLHAELIEASLLLALLDDSKQAEFPERELVELAAMVHKAPIFERLLNSDIDALPTQHYSIYMALVLAESLRIGSRQVAEQAYFVVDRLSPVWKEALDAVMNYLDQSYEQAFPDALLAGTKQRTQQAQRFQDDFKKLARILRDFSRRQFRSDEENKIWSYLFQRTGLFGVLLQLAENNDAERLQQWFVELNDRQARDILLEATSIALGRSASSLALFMKKASLEPLIVQILNPAQRLERETKQLADRDAERLIAAGKSLSVELARLWPALNAAVRETLDELSLPLALAALNLIEKIAQYNKP
jgi:hypothetical protein